MNRPLILKSLALCLAACIGVTVTGCKMQPKSPTPIPGYNPKPAGTQAEGLEPGMRIGGLDDPSGVGREGVPLADLDALTGMIRDEMVLRPYTVYFDFDRSTIKSSERSKVDAVASHLRANPSQKVMIEGNCDGRGTEGYNMALGERRALSVREYLINLGISADRVYTTSWGELNPVDPGKTEAAYSRNRRGDFVALLPPQ